MILTIQCVEHEEVELTKCLQKQYEWIAKCEKILPTIKPIKKLITLYWNKKGTVFT